MNKFIKFALPVLAILVAGLYHEIPKYQRYNDGLMHVYFLDVGHGDSMLVKTPDRDLILIDGGPGRRAIHEISDLIPFWVNKIDLIIATHPHADHITGLVYAFEKYEVGCILYDDFFDPISATEVEFRSIIDSLDILMFRSNDLDNAGRLPNDCYSNEDLDIYNFSFEWIKHHEYEYSSGDLPNWHKKPNKQSIITWIRYKDFDLLATGDAINSTQQFISPFLNEKFEIFKVPHQGAIDSFYPPLLKKIEPDLAVVFVQENNRYRHPHPLVSEGYKDLDIPLLATKDTGTIKIRTDGTVWELFD